MVIIRLIFDFGSLILSMSILVSGNIEGLGCWGTLFLGRARVTQQCTVLAQRLATRCMAIRPNDVTVIHTCSHVLYKKKELSMNQNNSWPVVG